MVGKGGHQMYLMPVTTFSDYLRAGRKWGSLIGGTLLLNFLLSSQQTQRSKSVQAEGLTRVEIKVDGYSRTVETVPADPYAIIQQAGIVLGPNDLVKVAVSTIEITRVEERLLIEDSGIPFSSEEKLDPGLPPGSVRVLTQGEEGLKREIVKLTLAGDREVGKQLIISEVVREPVKRVVASNPVPKEKEVSRGLSERAGARSELIVEATAYTHTGSRTATGEMPQVGTVAVDPRVIPLGTRLYVEGYGLAVAADTGGAIKGNRIDVFFNTFRECREWGRKKVKIYILAS